MANSVITTGPLGYYVHHHGTGHMQRALTICRHIQRPVIMLSSLSRPAQLPAHVSFVQLLPDVVPGYVPDPLGGLHYTPYNRVIFSRNQQLIDAWRDYDIRDLYVDVSIEVALLAKLYGLTVGYALMLGDRTDMAHSHGFDMVDYLLAHYDNALDEPSHHSTPTPIYYSGGISRYAKRPPQILADPAAIHTIVVTMSPQHETDISKHILDCASHFPSISWHIVGQIVRTKLNNVVSHGVLADPQAVYATADVIIGSGGTNTIMDAASFGKPFICIPEPRPYDEQLAAALALQRLQAAVYLPAFPTAGQLAAVFDELSGLNVRAFNDLVADEAAARAASIIERAGKPA